MLAIFVAVRREWDDRSREEDGDEEEDGGCWGHGIGMDGDVGMAIATLASLRLLVRVGAAADVMDRGGKWRVNVGWEVVRGLGRSMGVEVEEWLVES